MTTEHTELRPSLRALLTASRGAAPSMGRRPMRRRDAPARGIVVGLLLSLVGFWGPISLAVLTVVHRR
jgi:hypothetical protein